MPRQLPSSICTTVTVRPPTPIELLTVDEVAALLKVSKSWVYEHTRSRGVPRADRFPT